MTQNSSRGESGESPEAPAMRPSEGGFTLIELMVVIVILGLLIGLVVPNVWHALTSSTKDAAEIQMKNMSDAVQLYYLEERSLPSSLDDLTQESKKSGQKYLEKVPKDPWKQDYDYKILNAGKKEYQILSSGEDKTWGTDDDIVFPTKDQGK